MNGEMPSGFTMLGTADAAACEGDACLLPGTQAAASEPNP